MRTRVIGGCFVAWITVLTVLYYLWPAGQVVMWSAIALSSPAAVAAGIRWHRPSRPLPWYLLMAAQLTFACGDVLYYVRLALGQDVPFPSTSDLCYVMVYLLLAGGLMVFVRATSGGNRAALLDAMVPTAAVGLLAWVYVIAPYTRADNLTPVAKLFSVAYPLGDVLALAMLLRLLTAPGRKPAVVGLFGLSTLGLLVTDVFYALARLDTAWDTGGPTELGWVLYYGGIGLAALHPSMTALTVPRPATAPVPGGRRLALMTAAALVAPGVLLAQFLVTGSVRDAPVIAAGSALTILLVMARAGDLLAAQRRAHQRERALREANAALAEASGPDEVSAALHAAVAAMLPGPDAYRMVHAETAGAGRFEIVPVAGLDAEVAAGLAGFRYALCVSAGSAPGGSVYLGAARDLLESESEALLTLFQQVLVVLDRIRLTGEISRRDGEAYFRTLIQSAADVILIVGDSDEIRYATPSAAETFGRADLAGAPLHTLIADTHHDALRDLLDRSRLGHDVSGADLAAVRADRRLLQIECDARDLRADATVGGVVLTLRDVTERRRLENDLVHQAFHDELTGLANRVLFRNRLEHAFDLAGPDSTLGVVFVDLDDFKEVNDTLGHAVGDQLLIAVGRRIAHAIGTHNTAARMGGDEFAVLVEQAADPGAAEDVAARIVAALSVPVEVSDGAGGSHVVNGAASVGVATGKDAETATELLRHADLALYLAKDAGKGTWQSYRSDLHTAMVERAQMRTALHEAVEDEQFVLQFQPIVDLTDASVAGVESLVRWQHPARGLLGPNHFIEVAEENGAIVGIGAWVLRESLRQFAAWRSAHPDSPLGYVSVNVSARQFRTPGFVAQVRTALADTGSQPGWLLLEITESLVLRDAEQVWADLRELRALGVRIAIDDFGTGYSSLSYLRQMPVDVLKIDKSFIDDVLGSRQQRALVNAIVTLARNLDLAVVAEGIEDAAQRALLARMGCPYGQGYLFSKPVWPAQVDGLLRTPATVAG